MSTIAFLLYAAYQVLSASELEKQKALFTETRRRLIAKKVRTRGVSICLWRDALGYYRWSIS
jgi:hypothetical protein